MGGHRPVSTLEPAHIRVLKTTHERRNIRREGVMNMFAKKQLMEIRRDTESKLKKNVIGTLLDKGGAEDIESYITDLLEGGCQSGTEGSLIYYTDTLAFYRRFKTEIHDMLKELLSECGIASPAELFGDKWDKEDIFAEETTNQNLLAWFGFEETVRSVAYELEMDV